MNKKKYVKIYTLAFILVSLVYVVFSLCTVLTPIYLGKAIDLISEHQSFEVFYKKLLPIIISLILTASFFNYIGPIFANRVAYIVTERIRKDLFYTINNLTAQSIDEVKAGQGINCLTVNSEAISRGLFMSIATFIASLASIIMVISIISSINWLVAVIVVCSIPLSFLQTRFISKRAWKYYEKRTTDRVNILAFVNEYTSNKDLAYTTDTSLFIDKFEAYNKELYHSDKKSQYYSALINPVSRIINNLIYVLILIVSILLIANKHYIISIGNIVALLSYAVSFSKPINDVANTIPDIQSMQAAWRAINSIGDFSVIDNTLREDFNLKDGNIEFKNVSFSYKNTNKMILDNVNLKIESNSNVAIVGKIGCGKTTLINLLMGFFTPDKGEIYIDGQNIAEYKKSTVTKQIDVVMQDNYMLNMSILENISIGNSKITREEIISICKKTGAHTFISKLKDGYDTIIDNDNEQLSIGQKQLLALSRIMITKPKILIFDEATASLDTRREMIVQNLFNTVSTDKTTITIAHRFAGVINTDKIFVMKNGMICETGNHTELIAKKGEYFNLYKASIL